MDKYSPYYYDPKYQHDITKLSDQTITERLVFLGILNSDRKINKETKIELNPYIEKYNNEWKRRRLEANNNNN